MKNKSSVHDGCEKEEKEVNFGSNQINEEFRVMDGQKISPEKGEGKEQEISYQNCSENPKEKKSQKASKRRSREKNKKSSGKVIKMPKAQVPARNLSKPTKLLKLIQVLSEDHTDLHDAVTHLESYLDCLQNRDGCQLISLLMYLLGKTLHCDHHKN